MLDKVLIRSDIQSLTKIGFLALQHCMIADANKIFDALLHARPQSNIIHIGYEMASFLSGDEAAINRIAAIADKLNTDEKDLLLIIAFLSKVSGHSGLCKSIINKIDDNTSDLYRSIDDFKII